MKNLLVIFGSPRPKSNSTALAEVFLAEYHRLHPEDRVVVKKLHGMHIQACTGCGMCKRVGQSCILKDDMNVLYPLVRGADTLVYSSPVYWWGVSGQLKVFMDRLYALDHAAFAGKRLILIATGADGMEGIQYSLIKRQFQEVCDYLAMDFTRYLPISADDGYPASDNSQALEAAKNLAIGL
jgi:multimeric flavodoxin WrbA